ncbi:histidinol dehydrogenase [Buchnera aphidicola (Ceratoglyphina bambusae)]|uniref:histidinol dehydrogenase n=1 Tax=Buchnera aphidicola TaxID=9 RepID=UPI0031B85E36
MFIKNKIYDWKSLNDLEKIKVLNRPASFLSQNVKNEVKNILENVKKFGDSAIYKYSYIFDKIKINKIKINCKKIKKENIKISKKFKNAIFYAKRNIEKFHILQNNLQDLSINIDKGINCRYTFNPINNIGIYIPKGVNSNLISTMLMLCIPANIAGCKNIVICSPPKISNELLYVAKICNIRKIFQVGGAQAIAAMAFGTKTIPKVNKIFGPGNCYVTEAKSQISIMDNVCTSIDMIAGPSELLIISDKYSNPDFIASDLISQLEHGKDSHVILITNHKPLFKKVFNSLRIQLNDIPRKNIVEFSLSNSKFILTDDLINCIKISNLYSPEHLAIYTKNFKSLLKYVENAGSIFLGQWSPESIGDYASGTNHVLPTYGYASSVSGIGLKDFIKNITIQELTYEGFLKLSNTVETLSSVEGLEGHRNSIYIRRKYLKEKYNLGF